MNASSSDFHSREARLFVEKQTISWEVARNNYSALEKVQTRELTLRNQKMRLQYNPARITSSTAHIDSASLQARPCFLCAAHRPSQQTAVPFGEDYEILVNPYPILPYHLTIPTPAHPPQSITRRMGTMLQLARNLEEFVVFYNGPRCGASAPDHAHFHAGIRSFLPMEEEDEFTGKAAPPPALLSYLSATLHAYPFHSRPFFEIRSTEDIPAIYLFSVVYDLLRDYMPPQPDQATEENAGTPEPMMNLLAWYIKGQYILRIFPRLRHRPACYFAEGDARILLSPGTVDMGGLIAVPQKNDFDRITSTDLEQIFSEVCIHPEQMEELTARIR